MLESPRCSVASGLPAESIVCQDSRGGGYLPDKQEQFWLDGGDSDLFAVTLGPITPIDDDGDGMDDGIRV